jgi:hypothetical protein
MGAVTLYQDTWDNHIIVKHPEINGSAAMIEATVENPTAIYESTSVLGSFVFARNGMTDVAGRSLRVIVGADRSVKTAYFSSASAGRKRWP